MYVHDSELIRPLLLEANYRFKIVVNESGVVCLPTTSEHRDAARDGLRYADDYTGNALAGIVTPGRIEFRFHKDFSDQRVRALARTLLQLPEFASQHPVTVTYQNRALIGE